MLATAESWNDRFGPFFCKMYFLYVSRSRQKKLVDFLGVLPPQKSIFLWTGWLAGQISKNEGRPSILENCIIKKYRLSLVGELGWPLFQNWGAPLNSGILQNMKSYSLLYPLWWTDCDRLKARRMAVHWIFEWSTSQAVWCHHPQ